MASRTGNHNRNCATAGGHACACSGCGGSLHGWAGWVGLAKGTARDREEKRKKIEDAWRRNYKPGARRANARALAAITDFARLDIADWLAAQRPRVPHPRNSPGATDLPGGEQLGVTSGPASASSGAAGSSAIEPVHPSPVEQVELLATTMTDRAVWDEIAAKLAEVVPDRVETARQLADHGWCDLFIGLVQMVEEGRKLLDRISDWGKRLVKAVIHRSSMQENRPLVTEAVVDILVDKVWSALKGVAAAKVPVLSILTGDEAIRGLRILAVFSCPAPEKHDEVREHALKPLADDLAGFITSETKERLAKVFKEWTDEEASSSGAEALVTPPASSSTPTR